MRAFIRETEAGLAATAIYTILVQGSALYSEIWPVPGRLAGIRKIGSGNKQSAVVAALFRSKRE